MCSATIDFAPLVEQATRAPSSHNTQPWLFRCDGEQVTVLADRTRALPVNDPYDRELTISCAAAARNLELAARAAGHGVEWTALPEGEDSDALVSIRLEAGAAEGDDEATKLANAIGHRHTTRDAFTDEGPPDDLAARLSALADAGGCWLELLPPGEARKTVAGLVAEGDRRQFADPRWRRELASWMHPRRDGDGLTMPRPLVPVSRFVVKHFDLGASTSGSDQELALTAPLLFVLGTEGDDVAGWLDAGRALESILLTAAAEGLAAGYLNQPCQVAELRPALGTAVGHLGHPQLVVRLGKPVEALEPSPRRPVSDVLLES
jgi:nitroreductase